MIELLNRYDNEVAPVHQLVCLANAASFDNTFMSVPLTTFAEGWRDPANLEEELEFVAPIVEVPRKFQWRKWDEKDDFFIDSDDARAPGGDFKKVAFSGSLVESRTINRGLTVFIDADEVDDLERAKQRYTAYLLRRGVRSDLYTAGGLLVAGATNSAKTWNTSADPDTELLDLCEACADASGVYPPRIYMGSAAWILRVKAYRGQDVAGQGLSASWTPEQVAQWLAIERLFVSKSRYQSSASAKTKVTGSYAVAFTAEAGQISDDPSNIKRFVTRCGDGTLRRVYERQVSEKLVAISVERYVRTVVTSTSGLRKYTVS